MTINLAGHAALITGSTKGVGRSIVEAFVQAGASVVLHGRGTGVSPELKLADGTPAPLIASDLSGPTMAAVEETFAKAIAANPAIDILVNNAGNYNDVPFLDMDYERFERTMRLNVFAAFFLTQRF